MTIHTECDVSKGESKDIQSQDTEAEPCPCKEGMTPDAIDPVRRKFLFSAVAATTVGAMAPSVSVAANKKAVTPGAVEYDVADDPTKVMGRALHEDSGYGTRSQFETEIRTKADNPSDITSWTFTPLAATLGNLTPSGLHFERHHGGIPTIDPSRHDYAGHPSGWSQSQTDAGVSACSHDDKYCPHRRRTVCFSTYQRAWSSGQEDKYLQDRISRTGCHIAYWMFIRYCCLDP